MEYVDILGFVAAFFTTAATLPQLLKIVKTKHAGDVSIIMFSMTLVGVMMWLYYGYLTESGPLLVANAFSFIIISAIIYYKLAYNK